MAPFARAFFRVQADGVAIFVRLTPKASVDRIDGIGVTADGRAHLMARVRAVPDEGLANAALRKLLAASLGVALRDIALASGTTSRLKTLRVIGDPVRLATSLDAVAGAS